MAKPIRRSVLPAPAGLQVERFEADGEAFAIIELPRVPRLDHGHLTRSQRNILELLLEGRSNAEIARQRGRSARTVAHQVDSIFRRLGVGSRLELFARCWQSSAGKADEP
jgi:DNA-binding NarL/FixJ family response regulator